MRFSHRFTVIPVLTGAILLLGTSAGAQTINHQITLPSGFAWCSDSMINELASRINALRASQGLGPLAISQLGMKDAEMRAVEFANYMANYQQGQLFNPHTGYDATAASIGYQVYAENLAYMSSDPNYIVNALWLDNLHLNAMLNTYPNVMGVSCVYAYGFPFWTYEPGLSASVPAPTPPATTPPPASTPSTPSNPPSSGMPTLDSEEWKFLTLINNYRASNGAGPLQVSVMLENSSRWMSNDLATHSYFSHTDSTGRSAGARIASFGYTYSWGENLAAGYQDAQGAFDGLANACDPDSTGACTYAHRVNMLNPAFHAIGIARAYGAGSPYGWYWTTDLGTVVEQQVTQSGTPSTPTSPSSPTSPTNGVPSIQSFTASPSTITKGQSSTLSWNVTGATTIQIDNSVGTVTGTSKTVTPAQTTTYRLTASNSAWSISSTVTVTVNGTAPAPAPPAPPAADTQPPTAPVITSGSAKSTTEIDIAWNGSTDNIGVTGYQILRNGFSLASVGASVRSYADMSVVAGTQYSYAVRAIDAAGNVSPNSNALSVSTPAPAPAPSSPNGCPGPATGAFTACYFNTVDLSGFLALVRTDPQINFDWWTGSPDRAVSRFHFSARWSGNFVFNQGDYTFTVIASDGVRLYIDGTRVLDQWRDQPNTSFTVTKTLGQGTHLITVEYYEMSGTPSAHVSWQAAAAAPPSPAGPAPSISSFTASPTSIAAGQQSMLSWNVTGATTVSIDNGVGGVAAASSKAVAPIQTTTYKLTATNSTGTQTATVTVNVSPANTSDTQPPTAPIITSAMPKSPTQVDLAWLASKDNVGVAGYRISRNGAVVGAVAASQLSYSDTNLSAGAAFNYVVTAYDAAGNTASSASVQVTTPGGGGLLGCPAAAAQAFTACFYNTLDLTGYPGLVRTDSQVNFDWINGSPDRSISRFHFSSRWQGSFNFAGGNYTFTATVSDGARLYVDGKLVLDRWSDHPVTSYTVTQALTAGSHVVTLEYYTSSGTPSAHLSWVKN